jgi:hypothetical protein
MPLQIAPLEPHPPGEVLDARPAAVHRCDRLWRVWESLPGECRPWPACGDFSFGNESLMSDCEARGQKYLFRLRPTRAPAPGSD